MELNCICLLVSFRFQQSGVVERHAGTSAKDSKWTVSLDDFNLLTVIGRGE